MTVKFSPHAGKLLNDIIDTISNVLSLEDGLRWNEEIQDAVLRLEDYPFSGPRVPLACFETVPANAEQLRQILCRPYRIVYEVIDNEVHILSIRHVRMLVIETDTFWN